MFQTRLRELREAAGYRSQQAFADAFGVAQSTIGNWEAGKREPNYAVTIRLAQFFGVSVDYLINDEKGDLAMQDRPCTFFNKNGWPKDITEDYENAKSDEIRIKILVNCGYDEAHTYAAHKYFPWQFAEKKGPAPISEGEAKQNKIQIAGRDGTFLERELTDEQLAALKLIVDQLPDADNL